MKTIPTAIGGCHRFQLERLRDDRGHFVAVFDREVIRAIDPGFEVHRINRSFSSRRGTIRGVHFQRPPMDEDKLVQCLRGTIFDVCVDLRPHSRSYLRWVGAELSAENEELILVPRGCGHAFQTLSEDCVVEYVVTRSYSPSHEGGVRWDDPAIAIEWPLPCTMTSPRDATWPLLERARP